jgi:two-component system, NarL family, invasion response regulator UvrY
MAAAQKIKIVLADDHRLFRSGLAGLINRFGKYTILFEADNGRVLIDNLDRKNLPDIVILDINMPDMDGFETVRWLRDYHPQIKILVISMLDDENSVLRMLRMGIKGYLLKDTEPDELNRALDAIYRKGYYYTEFITGKLIDIVNEDMTEEGTRNTDRKVASRVHLSEKEIEFLKLCCAELTYKEIANRMSISSHTLDNHREILFEKLKVKTRVGLALYAVKNGLVSL